MPWSADELIEIQHGSLARFGYKIADLLASTRCGSSSRSCAKAAGQAARRGGKIVCRARRSPKRGKLFDLFHELVYFTKVFPHPRLTIEAVLVDVEEHRYPGHGRRRRWRRNDFPGRRPAAGRRGRKRACCAPPTTWWTCWIATWPRSFHTGQLAEAHRPAALGGAAHRLLPARNRAPCERRAQSSGNVAACIELVSPTNRVPHDRSTRRVLRHSCDEHQSRPADSCHRTLCRTPCRASSSAAAGRA